MFATIKISINMWIEMDFRIGDLISVTDKSMGIENCTMKIMSRTFNPIEEPDLYTVELSSIIQPPSS